MYIFQLIPTTRDFKGFVLASVLRICVMRKATLIPKAEVARKHGLSGFTNDQIASSFRAGKA